MSVPADFPANMRLRIALTLIDLILVLFGKYQLMKRFMRIKLRASYTNDRTQIDIIVRLRTYHRAYPGPFPCIKTIVTGLLDITYLFSRKVRVKERVSQP